MRGLVLRYDERGHGTFIITVFIYSTTFWTAVNNILMNLETITSRFDWLVLY